MVLALGLLLIGVLVMPSLALANNVSDAALPPGLGGGALLSVPADGHQVSKMYLAAGDWIIGYAWTPGTREATGAVNILDSTATDVASETVASSKPSGVLFWQAPAAGAYYCDFSAEPGSSIVRGLFLSHPQLSLDVSSRIIVPYGGGVTLSTVLSDPLYRYVPYDGPAVAFESVAVRAGHDGLSWNQKGVVGTDVNGRARFAVRGLSRSTVYRFDFPGVAYDSAGFGEARSRSITVLPRFHVTQRPPARVRAGVAFGVSGAVQPVRDPGTTNIKLEAHKRGSRKIFSATVRALAAAHGASPLRSWMTLPSAGTWYVRLRCPTDPNNAETATKWVRVVVR